MQVPYYKGEDKIMFEFKPLDDPQDFFGRNNHLLVEWYGDETVQNLISIDEVDKAEDMLYEQLLEQGVLHEIMVDCYKEWLDENF